MKNAILLIFSIAAIVIAILILVATSKSDKFLATKLAGVFGLDSPNLLVNSDFDDGLKSWKFTDKVSVIKTNGLNYVCIEGDEKKQKRIWQNVNVISGKTYRLTFKLSGPSQGAFCIFRDNETGKERYIWCTGQNRNKKYLWEINPTKSGEMLIFLSTSSKGTYCYSDVKFAESLDNLYKKYISISIILLSIALIILVRYDFSFVLIYIILALIPVVHINKEIKSISENRNLAIYKPLITDDNKINTNFGLDLNNWLNDRFWIREITISENFRLRYFIDRRVENSKAFQGSEGWLFDKFDPNLFLPYRTVDKLIIQSILEITSKYNKGNTKVFFVSIPEKNSIYSEFHSYRLYDKELLPEILALQTNINFISLSSILMENKTNDYVFFKDDHHWTQYGAFVSCRYLLEKFKQLFPDLEDLTYNNYSVSTFTNTYNNLITSKRFTNIKSAGSIYNQLNLKNFYNYTTYYKVFRSKSNPILEADFPSQKPIYTHFKSNNVPNDLKLMIIGDSNIAFMIPFVTTIFSECLLMQINDWRNGWNNNWNINNYSSVIDEYKPDILLLITRSSNLQSWIHLNGK